MFSVHHMRFAASNISITIDTNCPPPTPLLHRHTHTERLIQIITLFWRHSWRKPMFPKIITRSYIIIIIAPLNIITAYPSRLNKLPQQYPVPNLHTGGERFWEISVCLSQGSTPQWPHQGSNPDILDLHFSAQTNK